MNRTPLLIWSIRDGKAGHWSQVRGLIDALNALSSVDEYSFDIDSTRHYLKDWLCKRFQNKHGHPKPELIIGAGHRTHIAVLAAQRTFGGRSIILMNPSVPKCLFDLCIVPEHDNVAPRKNILLTQGILNPINGNADKDSKSGLMLIGGPSHFYHWDNAKILAQISLLLNRNQGIKWTVLTSRRTPDPFHLLLSKNLKNCTLLAPEQCTSTQYKQLIEHAGRVWVTQDSMSMIYEALTAGAVTGLIHVPERRKGRLTHAIQRLVEKQYLTTYTQREKETPLPSDNKRLCEAQRCASIIHKRWLK